MSTGQRYQVFLTDLADLDICYLGGHLPGRGRCECYIRDAKDTGLANSASADFAINQAWVTVLLAGDLLAQMRSLCLEGELARAEPKRLRYCLLPRRWRVGPLQSTHHATYRKRMVLGRPPR